MKRWILELEKRLAAVEAENKKSKKQIKDLQQTLRRGEHKLAKDLVDDVLRDLSTVHEKEKRSSGMN